tara:strand:- start:1105 stop:1764 length:660 start_codon:yes stop_codon:yes gene_type:complete
MTSEENSLDRVEVKNAFPTPIMISMISDYEKVNKKLKKSILLYEKKYTPKKSYDSNIGGWHSNRDFLEWGGKEGEKIIESAKFIADKITIGRNGRPQEINWQVNAWANINRKGHSNEFHVHPGCFWSGVYYVDDGGCSKDKSLGGEFVIMDPRGAAPSMYAPFLCFRGPGGNTLGATELVSPKNGIIMIFPAWLSHAVRPYHGEGERISVSFNLSIKNL